MEVGVRRQAQREEKELQSDRLTRKAFPGPWWQKTSFAQKGFSTSFPTGKQLFSPLCPDTSIGNIHLQMPKQSFQKDPLRVRGTSNSTCQELTSTTSLRTSWWRHAMDIPTSPK